MQHQPPHLDESTSASPALSPGPVQDQEALLRIIIDPDHTMEGRIQPSAIQLRDLTQRGLSVHRRGYATRQEVERIVQAMLGRTITRGARRLEGLATKLSQRDERATAQPDDRQAYLGTGIHRGMKRTKTPESRATGQHPPQTPSSSTYSQTASPQVIHAR